MKLIIVRHAEPDYAKDSLTEKGFREAELLSQRMAKENITKIYVSPLGRAAATAKPTLEKLAMTAETREWLREFRGNYINPNDKKEHYCWDLMPSYFTAADSLYHPENWLSGDMNTANVGEEYSFVCDGIDSLLAENGYVRENKYYRAVKANTDTVVLFCHYAVECVILSRIFSCSPVIFWQHFVALPSSVTVLNTEEREKGIAVFRCSSFGDVSHLYAGNEPLSFAARFCETYDNFEQRH